MCGAVAIHATLRIVVAIESATARHHGIQQKSAARTVYRVALVFKLFLRKVHGQIAVIATARVAIGVLLVFAECRRRTAQESTRAKPHG